MIDGILDHDIASVVEILPIDPDIKSALLGETTYLTNYLDLAKHFEQGQWLHCESIAQQFGLSMDVCSAAHIEAMSWADSMLSV